MSRIKDSPDEIALRASIGLRLRALREIVDLPQEKIAASLGVAQNTYQKWEKGKLFPNPVAVISLCAKYKVHFNFIYQGDFEGLAGKLAAQLAQRLPPIG